MATSSSGGKSWALKDNETRGPQRCTVPVEEPEVLAVWVKFAGEFDCDDTRNRESIPGILRVEEMVWDVVIVAISYAVIRRCSSKKGGS